MLSVLLLSSFLQTIETADKIEADLVYTNVLQRK